jgi:hypothetical protein
LQQKGYIFGMGHRIDIPADAELKIVGTISSLVRLTVFSYGHSKANIRVESRDEI